MAFEVEEPGGGKCQCLLRLHLDGVKGSPRPRRDTADTPPVSFQAACPSEEAELRRAGCLAMLYTYLSRPRMKALKRMA